MVLCVVLGCYNCSCRDKGISFFRIPAVITHRGPQDLELSKKRRNGFIAAISRENITETILSNDRVCSKHFLSGKPAGLYDVNNPDWLPTLYLGHDKSKNKTPVSLVKERYERMASRKKGIAAREKAISIEAAIREEASTREETSTREEAVAVHSAAEALLLLTDVSTPESDSKTKMADAMSQTDLTLDDIFTLEKGIVSIFFPPQTPPFSEPTLQSNEKVNSIQACLISKF